MTMCSNLFSSAARFRRSAIVAAKRASPSAGHSGASMALRGPTCMVVRPGLSVPCSRLGGLSSSRTSTRLRSRRSGSPSLRRSKALRPSPTKTQSPCFMLQGAMAAAEARFGKSAAPDRVPQKGRRNSNHADMPDRFARRDRLHSFGDALRVDAEVPVEIRNRPGLAEMLDPERAGAVTINRAKPGERRRMAVNHRHEWAMRGNIGEQALDVASRVNEPVLACALRGHPAGIEPIGGSDCEKSDVAPVFADKPNRLDRLRRD